VNQDHYPCQITCWPHMAEANVKTSRRPLRKQIKMFLKRHLSMERKRQLKRLYDRWVVRRQPAPPPARTIATTGGGFQPGDKVRVRSEDEIRAMLNSWDEFKGCSFMSGMWQYCGTTQRVLKPVKQFLDERDYRLKKVGHIVLLEGLMCQGMEEYGPCDRSCFFFWREEWLEPVE
jgi:hypothetical protein